jgi:hypothetical protein
VLITRFPENIVADPMEQLQQLKQQTTVNTYIDAYETWMTQMKRTCPYLPQMFFVDRFTSGLKDSIKHLVQCQKPDSLLNAYWYARKYEQAYLCNVKKATAAPIAPPPQRAYNQQQQQRLPPRDNRNGPNIPQQNRAQRECWHCHGRFFLGHRCPQMQQAIRMIELQGLDEATYQLDQGLHDPPPPAIEQVQVMPIPEAVQPAENVPVAQADEVAMSISAAAYSGCPSDSTISLLLQINKTEAVALADTGSTSTFMDMAFAKKNKIPLTAIPARTVKVAGGGTLTSSFMAQNCKFTVEGHKFETNFRILELQGADVILGVNWFKQHNPVTFDFLERKLTIGVQGKLITLHDHLLPVDKLLISFDTCNKLIAQGGTGYLLIYTATTDETEEQVTEQHSSGIQTLLNAFKDIFETPSGLPPPRDVDHQIPLKEGAKPPNIRPYRMSHSQKNIVEQIIKDMLQRREIRISKSPYSSPILLVTKKDRSWRL